MTSEQVLLFIIPGEPISKSNAAIARWDRKTKKSQLIIPEKYAEYEMLVKHIASQQMKENLWEPFTDGPVVFEVIYWLSARRVKDLPNLPKTTCDALEGVAYTNDTQITHCLLHKAYDKENPRTEIRVSRPINWIEKINAGVYDSLPEQFISKYRAPVEKKARKPRGPNKPKSDLGKPRVQPKPAVTRSIKKTNKKRTNSS